MWLEELWLRLRFARRIEVDPPRRLFIFDELHRMNYDVRQAKRAEAWMLHGDWRFKGSDPTVELADFTPTEEQYAGTFAKVNARAPIASPATYQQPQQPKPSEPMATPEQIQALRAKLADIIERTSSGTK